MTLVSLPYVLRYKEVIQMLRNNISTIFSITNPRWPPCMANNFGLSINIVCMYVYVNVALSVLMFWFEGLVQSGLTNQFQLNGTKSGNSAIFGLSWLISSATVDKNHILILNKPHMLGYLKQSIMSQLSHLKTMISTTSAICVGIGFRENI